LSLKLTFAKVLSPNDIVLFMSNRIPEGKAPRFPKKPTIQQRGDILVMECILEAQPLPEIKWFLGSKQINLSDRVKMTKKETGKDTYILCLEITNPTIADGGSWRCNAVNAFGESNANITLNFQGTFNKDPSSAAQTPNRIPSHPRLNIALTSLLSTPRISTKLCCPTQKESMCTSSVLHIAFANIDRNFLLLTSSIYFRFWN
jgi:hypothetical protein